MEQPRKKHLIPVEGKICVPPDNKFNYTIVGHWDNNENKFIPSNDDLMNRFIQAEWEGCTELPLIINVHLTETDGEFRTYRALGDEASERTIIHITAKDVKMPTYKEIKNSGK